MKTYAGIDLHSSNNFIGISDDDDKRLYGKRLPNDLGIILSALEPFRESLSAVVVESTYNWYWLVDGLRAEGYQVHLANPSAIQQYEGWKASTTAQKYYYQRKAAKTKTVVTIKALSHKLARASYYIMRDKVPYDPVMLFR